MQHSPDAATRLFSNAIRTLALTGALAAAACGASRAEGPAPAARPGPPGTPTLSFVPPQESLDLANYTLTLRATLPVNLAAGANQIAAEVSAVTYDEATDSLFIVGDEGTYVTRLSKTGALIDTMRLPPGLFGDPEGITAVGDGRFVVSDERERSARLFRYVGGDTLDPAAVLSVKLGTTIGNIGLEGVSLDPLTGGYIFVKEMKPQGIFQTTLDFAAGTASNGSATTVNSTNLFDPALMGLDDIADVYALSNTLPDSAPDRAHLMVLSQENGRILKVDRAGRVYGRLDLPNGPKNLGHEGITFDRELNMYITNEAGGGSREQPQLWVYAPTRNAAQVGVGSNLYLGFDMPVAGGAGDIVLVGSNGDRRSIAVTDARQVSFSGNTLRIDPGDDLAAGTTYSIAFAAGVLRDLRGRAVPAVGGDGGVRFTTR